MTLVVDASALVKLVLEEEYSEAFGDIFYTAALHEKVASPDFALAEALNAIWKHVKLLGDLPERDGLEAAGDLLELWSRLDVYSLSSLGTAPLREAVSRGLTVYDAAYLALAENLGARLATFDKRLRAAAGAAGIGLEPPSL